MITSLQNEQVKYIVSLHRSKTRDLTKEFLIEGSHLLEESLKRNASISKVFFCSDRLNRESESLLELTALKGIKTEEISEKVLRKISTTEEPQSVLATVKQTDFNLSDISIGSDTILLILDGIQDPGNLGTILRTALAAGITQACLTPGTVDPYNPKVLRSTMGAIFGMKLLRNQSPEGIINFCTKSSLEILLGDKGGENLFLSHNLKLPAALIVGNEGSGPSEIFKSTNVKRITIPMANDVESLNVAIASGILLYELVRRRNFIDI